MSLLFLKKISFPILFLLASLSANAQPIIHRAVEPAQILLDITLNEKSLTLYLTIPGSAAELLSSDKNHSKITSLLTEAENLWTLPPEAECTLKSRRVFSNINTNSEQVSGKIQGFFDFYCSAPESIHSIKPELNKVFPGLKQLNIWITTDSWQNKQSIRVPKGIINI